MFDLHNHAAKPAGEATAPLGSSLKMKNAKSSSPQRKNSFEKDDGKLAIIGEVLEG